MFTESAELYDAIYLGLKDYAAEAHQVAALLAAHRPGCRSVLDVGCGTGEHARLLAERHGLEVDGLDLDPALLELARAKHPGGTLTLADMRDFDLGRRYDAVVSLFSSIGYLHTLEELVSALRRFAAHLAPGGVVLVEPWLTPDAFRAGHRSEDVAEAGGVRVRRRSSSEREGRLSRIRFDYEIEGPSGVRRASEEHELRLTTVEEMLGAFEAAGLRASHEPGGPAGRGLYVAR